MADVHTFVEKTQKLLNLEREAEINETRAYCESADSSVLEKKGVCLVKLVVFSRKTGLYGRSLLNFGKRKPNCNVPESTLPANCITSGDIVGLSYSTGDTNISELSSGIVTKVTSASIMVAFDDSLDSQTIDDDALFRLTRLANDITHKRMKRALETLCNATSFPCGHLVDVAFGTVPIGQPLNLSTLIQGEPESNITKTGQYFNNNLNESQKMAVQFALTSKEIGVIHGPAGTGKTTTVVEVVVQAVKNYHLKVLACAPSNIAVDNIVERLVAHKLKVVRLGHPARVLKSIQGYSLDAILDSSDGTAIVKDVRKDIDMTQTKLKYSRDRGERGRLRSEIKTLRRELREREEKALKQILQNADVILSTNVSASEDGPLKHLPKDHFDLVIIDEVAQALEAACWIPLLYAPRCILAGDHKQLPPTILSRDAAKQGLERTLMERVIDVVGDKVVHMLTTQYRMNEKIMKWSSDQLYEGRLQADSSVAQHLLHDLPEVDSTELTSIPLLLIDTAGCHLYELETPDGESKGNEGEAEVVTQHIEALVNTGVKPDVIGVITPYNLQVELLRSRLSNKYPTLEIKSVDGFQGREKEVIIISMVRSNNKGEIGFLAENRRTNVAVTRARRHLTIVADSTTVSGDPFLKTLIDYVGDQGEVWSAEQYRNQMSGDSVFSLLGKTTITGGGQKQKTQKGKGEVKMRKGKGGSTDGKGGSGKVSAEDKGKKVNNGISKNYNGGEGTSVTNKDSDDKRAKLENEIIEFMNNATKFEMEFCTTLTAEERFIVHSIAEDLELTHISKGSGNERFIALSKLKVKPNGASDAKTRSFEVAPKCLEEKQGSRISACSYCEKLIPESNLELHEVRCKRERQQEPGKDPGDKDKRKSSKKSGKLPREKNAVKQQDGDKNASDFDELLAGFVRNDSQCAFTKCEKSILTVGQTCRCCGECFCLGHHIPEVHGCTQAAKVRARNDATATATGNQRQQTNKAATKNAHLRKKLENKLKNLEEKRKIKQKTEQKK